MLEERIAVDVHLVEVDVGFAAIEAEGRRRGDEVDFVAAGGEFDAEFSGDHAAAAIRGITGDTDLAFGRHEGSGRPKLDVRAPCRMLPDSWEPGVNAEIY